mmetsp:Transcript_9566/g.11798  ORF Transcript_9566/g.11798 Transcript_9566/m.11798 type:complete len:635 (-) Transcript_9566:64-1968(-)
MSVENETDSVVHHRRVLFGNPALGTYGGCVHTIGTSIDDDCCTKQVLTNDSNVDENLRKRFDCITAMVHVPPEQFPDGILNLSRAHRPYIRHMRVMFTANDDEVSEDTINSDITNENKEETKDKDIDEEQTDEIADEHEQQSADRSASNDNESNNNLEEEYEPIETSFLVLFELSSQKAADSFVKDLHRQPYTSLQADVTAGVYNVCNVSGDGGVNLLSPFFATELYCSSSAVVADEDEEDEDAKERSYSSPLHQQYETNNCPVCLEPMIFDSSLPSTPNNNVTPTPCSTSPAIVTTVCNHSFHVDCLYTQWQDSPCPVCRYDHSYGRLHESRCHACGITEHNYVCLICGVVSCGGAGRDASTAAAAADLQEESFYWGNGMDGSSGDVMIRASPSQPANTLYYGHAHAHYTETLHAYALEVDTQHVWDFAGDGYVHRLIRNDIDGKLVEVNDPTTQAAGHTGTSGEDAGLSRTHDPGLTSEQEERVVHRKLEHYASEYYTLLKSQLEQQRVYYETRLTEVRREHEQTNNQKQPPSTSDLILALKQERNQLEQRIVSLKKKRTQAKKETDFLTSMNESLESNKDAMHTQLREAQGKQAEARDILRKEIPELERKVQNLMLKLTSEVDERKPAGKL